MRETAEKLRKTMEQQARQQSEYMTTKDQLTSTEKAKVRETPFQSKGFSFHKICTTAVGCYWHLLRPHSQAALDFQVKELTTRLEEGVINATKNAKKEAAKLHARVGLNRED